MRLKNYFLALILFTPVFMPCNSKSQETTMNAINMIKMHIIIDDKAIETRDPMYIIDPIWWSVSIYDSKEKYDKDLEPFSFHQRAVFALIWYMEEVNNGGHAQFYSNSTGIVWEDALEGFKLIGLTEVVKIIEESTTRFGSKPSFDRNERIRALDSMDINFDDLDSRFYKLNNDINITEQIADYIQKYKKEFYFEGEIEVPDN